MKKVKILVALCIILNFIPVIVQGSTPIEATVNNLPLHELAGRLIINIIAIFLLAHVIYFRRHKNRDFQFTLILFNCVNFLICFLLSGANLGVGFAFGLFAIFSIMRYRTVTIPVKEMGYLFICVAMGLVNSLATAQDNFVVLMGANAVILILPLILDSNWLNNQNGEIQLVAQDIVYERIELIKPENRNEMIKDLCIRTGLKIQNVDIIGIDLMQDIAIIKAYYPVESGSATPPESKPKDKVKPINNSPFYFKEKLDQSRSYASHA